MPELPEILPKECHFLYLYILPHQLSFFHQHMLCRCWRWRMLCTPGDILKRLQEINNNFVYIAEKYPYYQLRLSTGKIKDVVVCKTLNARVTSKGRWRVVSICCVKDLSQASTFSISTHIISHFPAIIWGNNVRYPGVMPFWSNSLYIDFRVNDN